MNRSLSAHLRAALAAAVLLCFWQIVLETFLIAAHFRAFLLSPYQFSNTQAYDFCVKLFLLVPAGAHWLRGGGLDQFLGEGFYAKLAIGRALIVPNLIVGGAVAVLVGVAQFALRRRATITSALWMIVGFGLLVNVGVLLAALRIPDAWSMRVVARNVGRELLWDGAALQFLAVGVAAGIAALLARLRASARWTALSAAAVAVGLALLVLTPPSTASLRSAPSRQIDIGDTSSLRGVQNVLFISIDSLRADRLGCYGNSRATSPTLDRLAREGVRFSNTMSTTSWTLPSHMSMMTGRYVLDHGVLDDSDRLSDSVPTLAEQLKAKGLTTGGIVSMLFLGSRYGFNRGFDDYDDHSIPSADEYDALHDEPAPKVTALATKWLQQHAHQPFFLFLHFWDVHYDYVPPPPYDTMFDPDYRGSITGRNFYYNKKVRKGMNPRDLEDIIALYDGEIRWVDDHIAKIVGVLDDLGISDRTAVIVTADHGDEFFEHGSKGHRRTLYQEVVHVPLIMRIPGVAPGRVIDAPTSLVDIMPTILSLVGAQIPPGVDGVSLLPALLGRGAPDEGSVYAELCRQGDVNCKAMQRSPVGTLIHVFEPMEIEFYGLNDVKQSKNLARTHQWPRQQQMSSLGDRLNQHWQVYRGLESHRGTVKLDEATTERLRALGYGD